MNNGFPTTTGSLKSCLFISSLILTGWVSAAGSVQAQDTLPSLPPSESESAPAVPDIQPQQPVAVPVPTQVIPGGVNQVPSLPPTPGPRFEPPLTVPGAAVNPAAFDGYHLGPGDSIFVSVQRYPDLSFQATLDLQGNIIVPLQGAVPFEGLTLAEAEARLRGVYNQYVVIRENRDVAITLVAQRGVEVTILGAVQRPGFYPLADPSVATALLTAGGATRTSDLRDIQVQRQIRRDGSVVENTVNVDLFTPLKEGSPLPNVRLEDGDVVVIPELDPSQLDEYDSYLVARSTLAQPVINVRFLNYAGGRGGVGTLNLNNGSSFLDAVTLLGVNPDNANLGDVALIRYDPETGRAVTVSIDAKSAILGDITQNPPLQDSDVIVVGRNLIGRLSFALQTVTRPFRDVIGFSNFFNDFLQDGFFNNNNN
ncbi:MAG: polysaccharide biosynthesis/export family protein [Cyanobacteria bacterium J06560_2]